MARHRRRRSHMNHSFSQVPQVTIQRSSFNRSHCHKTTFNSGYLIPIYVDEVLPGDTFNLRMTAFARLATPIFPIMDNMFMDFFFFFVPNRLLWDNWQKFNGEQKKPGDSTDFVVPQVNLTDAVAVGSFYDYIGVPPGVAGLSISALYPRAYNLIWNEHFRDENLQDPVAEVTGDGPDAANLYNIVRRGKRHDYFTSALPWPQKGPGVSLPLAGNAPVGVSASGVDGALFHPQMSLTPEAARWPVNQRILGGEGTGYSPNLGGTSGDVGTMEHLWFSGISGVSADMSGVTAATINSLRQAFQLQRLLERDARGGTRYVEILKSHFGVTSPDSRLQRPEYLGGGQVPVNISQVLQTSSTDDKSPQGNTAAFGTSSAHRVGFSKSFVEHGVIIGLCSVRADLTYQQGLSRLFSRKTRFDYYWPALSHIGEQTVLNREIYAQGTEQDEGVFGYQERYAEYRYHPSRISGVFRSTAPQPLDAWHLAQKFENLPRLNDDFIRENPPVARVIAVQDEPHFLFDSYFSLKCVRPMPVFGVPGFVDHF